MIVNSNVKWIFECDFKFCLKIQDMKREVLK